MAATSPIWLLKLRLESSLAGQHSSGTFLSSWEVLLDSVVVKNSRLLELNRPLWSKAVPSPDGE